MTVLFIVALFMLGMGCIIGAFMGSVVWGIFGAILSLVALILWLGDDPK